MQIKNKQERDKGKFFIEAQDKIVAEMDYEVKDKIITITHTEVDDILSGHGVGKELLSEAIDYTRRNSFKIKATCPFAKHLLDKSHEYADIYLP